MIVLSRFPDNKETSKDERNRKICVWSEVKVFAARRRARISRLEHSGFSIL